MICSLPPDLVGYIFSFDDTYKQHFDIVLFELQFLSYIRILKKRLKATVMKIDVFKKQIYFRRYNRVFRVTIEERQSSEFRDTLRRGFLKNIRLVPDSFLGRYSGVPDFAVQCWKKHLSENELFEIFSPEADIEYLLDMWLEEGWSDYTLLTGLFDEVYYFYPYWFLVDCANE